LWTEPSVTFNGDFVQLSGASVEPKPFQKPYPRLWFGGSAEAAVRRGVRLCDAFFGAGGSTTAAFAAQVALVRESLTLAGRTTGFGPDQFPIAKRIYIGIDPSDGAGAEMILFTPMHDETEHMELIAAELIPALGLGAQRMPDRLGLQGGEHAL
jgi:hypothetical protein